MTDRFFDFPSPTCGFLNMNDREHFRVKARKAAAWKLAAYYGGLGTAPTPSGRALPPSVVQCRFEVIGTRRRDPHNWFATVKPVIDGLVQAGLWPDDNSDHVTTTEPLLLPVKAAPRHFPARVLRTFVVISYRKDDPPHV